jgi:hypothetical protein
MVSKRLSGVTKKVLAYISSLMNHYYISNVLLNLNERNILKYFESTQNEKLKSLMYVSCHKSAVAKSPMVCSVSRRNASAS